MRCAWARDRTGPFLFEAKCCLGEGGERRWRASFVMGAIKRDLEESYRSERGRRDG